MIKQNYLVTGAAGFIGSQLAKVLIEQGHNVYTIDNLSTGHRENLPSGITFIEGGVHENNIIRKIDGVYFDAIFHIAGQSSGEISFEKPVYDLQTNTQSTLLLLELARRTGCPRFIYASTMSVYGDQDVLPVKEQAIPVPKSFYAVGKLASENYLRIFSQFGIKCTALRLFNVYGPGQNLQNLKQGMVSIYLAQALKDGKIVVKGQLERFRDFVFIDDVVNAFLKVLDMNHSFEILNISSGIKTSVGEVVQKIRSYLSDDTQLEVIEGTPGDQFGIYGDASRAEEILGWKALVQFDEGVGRMIDWAKGSYT